MTISQAANEGIKAFNLNEGIAPTMKFIRAVCACKELSARALLEARLHGWTVAKLAHGHDNDPARPSVIELKRLQS